MRMALRSLTVTLVAASGYAIAGVSIGELAASAGSAQTLALAAAAALAATALVVAVCIVTRPGAGSSARPILSLALGREPRVSARASLPHLLPSPRAPADVASATA